MYDRHLPLFIQVADSGSFSKASAALFISSAALIKQINAFEDSIGVKLLNRTTQGVSLTAAGATIYHEAKEIIARSVAAIEQARKVSGAETRTIRVGTSPFRSAKMVVTVWSQIADEKLLPFEFEIVSFDDSQKSLEAMLSALGKEIDCFFGPCDIFPKDNAYLIRVLGYLPCRIALSRKHPLSKKKCLSLEDLHGETLTLLPQGVSPVIDQIYQELRVLHPEIHLQPTRSFYGTETLNECVRNNYLIHTFDIWADIHPALVTRPVGWKYRQPYGIMYSPSLSKSQLHFIDLISSYPYPLVEKS